MKSIVPVWEIRYDDVREAQAVGKIPVLSTGIRFRSQSSSAWIIFWTTRRSAVLKALIDKGVVVNATPVRFHFLRPEAPQASFPEASRSPSRALLSQRPGRRSQKARDGSFCAMVNVVGREVSQSCLDGDHNECGHFRGISSTVSMFRWRAKASAGYGRDVALCGCRCHRVCSLRRGKAGCSGGVGRAVYLQREGGAGSYLGGASGWVRRLVGRRSSQAPRTVLTRRLDSGSTGVTCRVRRWNVVRTLAPWIDGHPATPLEGPLQAQCREDAQWSARSDPTRRRWELTGGRSRTAYRKGESACSTEPPEMLRGTQRYHHIAPVPRSPTPVSRFGHRRS